MHARTLLTATLLALALPAVAADKTAEVHAVSASGIGEKIGTVTFADSDTPGRLENVPATFTSTFGMM